MRGRPEDCPVVLVGCWDIPAALRATIVNV